MTSAQGNVYDSLWESYTDTSRTIDLRLKAIDQLSMNYMSVDLDSGQSFSDLYYNLAVQARDTLQICWSLDTRNRYLVLSGEHEKSTEALLQAHDLALKAKLSYEVTRTLINIGVNYKSLGEDITAIEYLQRAEKSAQKDSSIEQLAFVAFNLGTMYDYYDREKVKYYYELAIEYSAQTDNKLLNLSAEGGLALALYHLGDTDLAKTIALENMRQAIDLEMPVVIASIGEFLGSYYRETGNPDSAIFYYNLVLEQEGKLEYSADIIESMAGLGAIYHEQGDFQKAIDICSKGQALGDSVNLSREKMSCLECLVEVYHKSEKWEEYGHYSGLYFELKNSFMEETKVRNLTKLELENQFASETFKDSLASASLLNIEQEKTRYQAGQKFYFVIGAITVSLILIGFLFFALNRNKIIKEQEALIKQEYLNLKEFTENASHEMQTPMAVIHSKLEALFEIDGLTQSEISKIESAYIATTRMSELNSSLLLLTKIENNQFHVSDEVNLSELTSFFARQLSDFVDSKNLELKLLIAPQVIKKMNRFLAETIVSNLLSNAVRHNYQNGKISIELNGQSLRVINTGKVLNVDPNTLFETFREGRRIF